MEKRIIAVVICLVAMTANAANIYNVRADATFELKSFFSAVSSMVDDTDPSDPEKFAEQFSGEVFRFNGKKMELEDFLVTYRNKVMVDERIAHSFTLTKIEKKADMGNVYQVEGFLERISLDDTWKSKRKSVNMDIVYDEEWESGKKLQILAVKMDTSLVKIYPKTEERYEFSVEKNPYGMVSYKGSSFNLNVRSKVTTYIKYEGIDSRVLDEKDVDFSVETYRSDLISTQKYGTKVSGRIPANSSRKERKLSLKLKQHNSGRVLWVEFNQEKHPVRPFKFTLTNYNDWNEINAHYLDKENYGLTYRASIEDTRISIGFSVFFSPTYKFSGNDSQNETSSHSERDYIDEGYHVNVKTYSPGDDDYLEAYPHTGDYKKSHHFMALVFNTGLWLTDFLRLDAGIGYAISVNRYEFEKAHDVFMFEYQKIDKSLPDLPNQAITCGYKEDYVYDEYNRGLLLKPGLTLSIPFSESFRMNLSGAYLYAPKISNMEKKWDLSIGFAWEI